ncbi:MAG: cardiolipin synthase [Porphyromonas sp.]|nr:cardiolipin synthase [Porphyromonas sp.]
MRFFLFDTTDPLDLFWQLFYFFLVLGVILVIISQNRQPLKAVNWILVLILIPPVGLFLYFFFGIEFRGKPLVPLRRFRRIMSMDYPQRGERSPHIEIDNDSYREIFSIPENQLGTPLTTISDIKFYTWAKEKYEALLKDIEEAKHHIHLQYYIIVDDNIGNRIKDALIRKAKEGVMVRVLYDHLGSLQTNRAFWKELRKGGVEVGAFLPVVFPFLTNKANYRNHRKIVVIDGKIGYLGGMNIADRYIHGTKLGEWKDSHFRVEGAGVGLLENAFMVDWYIATRRLLPKSEYGTEVQNSELSGTNSIPSLFFPTSPTDQWFILQQTMIKALMTAKRSVHIVTPYLLPPEPLNRALIGAALAGIDVKILIPKKADVRFVSPAMLSYTEEMVKSGIKILRYRKGFNHSKIMVIDEEISIIGSANLDARSLEHNFEITGIIYDSDLGATLVADMERDMKVAYKEPQNRWSQLSILHKMWCSVCRLIAPQL